MEFILVGQNEFWCVRSLNETFPKRPVFARSANVNLDGHW